ncbi:MAG: HEAT repeat domain-containing protein [Synechococcales cyanobacterium CRU_2_2]|nr:HEAT repeat domain-containing protein [Synechococcales cyanobacterium CRU_2_2]
MTLEPRLQLQPLLAKLDQAATAEQVRFAVEEIAAACLADAVPILIAVLGYNNPGAAVAAVDGLIAIGEPAVLPLIELLDGFNYGARAWALRALSGIGDPRGMDLVVKAALEDFALSVRRAAARGVGTLRWAQFPGPERPASQKRAIETLIQVCADPEWVVRYAAVTGLEALWDKLDPSLHASQRPGLKQQLRVLSAQDESRVVRGRARLALWRSRALEPDPRSE